MLAVLPAQAYKTIFSAGVRGGAQTVLPQAKSGDTWSVQNAFTGGGMVDFRYAFYGDMYRYSDILWGFCIGLGAGVSSEALQGTLTDHYRNWDYDLSPMDYTVHSSFHQSTVYARAELSIMMAFCFGPVTLNIGPRFVLPLAPKATMTVDDVTISTYYAQYGVTVTDELVTGKLDNASTHTVQADRATGMLQAGAEVGYEWQLDKHSGIGLQAYADFTLLNVGSLLEPDSEPMIDVAPIRNKLNPVPAVEVRSITNYIGNYRSIEFGLRVYYTFSVQQRYNRRRY